MNNGKKHANVLSIIFKSVDQITSPQSHRFEHIFTYSIPGILLLLQILQVENVN